MEAAVARSEAPPVLAMTGVHKRFGGVRALRGADFAIRTPGAVHALSGARVRSVQFHLESVLTEHGPRILREMIAGVDFGSADRPVPAAAK